MKTALHQGHQELDDEHWWFVARRRIVLELLRPRLQGRPRILDIGCGGGATLRELTRFGEAFGVDPEPSSVEMARARAGCDVRLGALPNDIPFEADSFDLITLLDVLEHVPDDRGALETIAHLLRPGGLLLCTVPAYRFLWSEHDVVNEHQRRYTRPELRRRLEEAGLQPARISYYNMLLFPPVAVVRLLRAGHGNGRSDLKLPARLVNGVLQRVFASERHWLRRANLPFGVSIFTLAEKPVASAGRTA